MKILIDIGHPAHVHLFKNFAWKMQEDGHKILFTIREKEFERELLTKYRFKFISFGKKYNSKVGKVLGLFKFDLQEYLSALKFKPDIFFSHGSFYAAQAAYLYGKPHIALEDTGNMEQMRLYLPFTKVVLAPDVLQTNVNSNKLIKYPSYHELAYLHPNRFKPNPRIYNYLKIDTSEKFAILRFIAWNASHDFGQTGLSVEKKLKIVNYLNKYIKVFISSESQLSDELIKYKINIPPELMHDALYYASIFIGEGATMAAEAAVLGTPSIYINPLYAANCIDLQKFKLSYNLTDLNKILSQVKEIIKDIPKSVFKERKEKMLKEKIDPTSLFIWFIKNYPNSKKILKTNSDFVNSFK